MTTIEQIRALKYAEPFRPFRLVTVDGQVLTVHRSEYVATENRTWNRRVAVLHSDGSSSLLQEIEIVKVEHE
jgi:hypothetical protein